MTPTPFARRVIDGMRRKDLTLRAFCREVSLDPSFISKVLSGRRSPPAEEAILRRIARCLELDASELVVSAGRIPSSWHRLTSDAALFRRVDSIAGGAEAAPVKAPAPRPQYAASLERVPAHPSPVKREVKGEGRRREDMEAELL